MDAPDFKQKSFWQKPEGVTGLIFLSALVLGGGYLFFTFLPAILVAAQNTLYLAGMLAALGAVVYMVLDPKMRNLIWYMYKSVMRSITGVFVQIDPVGILKSYVEDLKDNLRKMSKQVGVVRGQMRRLKNIMTENNAEIAKNMQLASVAQRQGKQNQVVLSTRKAARLKESNSKYQALHNKLTVLYRILDKMYKNSEILIEDTEDQVKVKEQERKAIRASHSAMKSAMSVISGDPDKRAMFDAAMENIADDVAGKVGEMERFMEMSANFMDSIDLQNGVFEEQGMAMLEEWEQKSTLMLLDGTPGMETLDLDSPRANPQTRNNSAGNDYEQLFD